METKTYQVEQSWVKQKGKKPYECPILYKIFYKVKEDLIDVVEFSNTQHYLKFLDLLDKEGYSGDKPVHYELPNRTGNHRWLLQEAYRGY